MNTFDKWDIFIDQVCNHYGFRRELLCKRNVKPIRSIVKKVGRKNVAIDISAIRMTMAYIITKYSSIPIAVIGPMVGYIDHSTIPYLNKKISIYLEMKDLRYAPYWETINKIADSISINRDYVRETKRFIHMVQV